MSDTNASAPTDSGNGTPAVSAAPQAEWHANMGFDQETTSWMENRGLTKMDSGEALKNTIAGFRNAEKFIGVPSDQLLRLPNYDKASAEELGNFYNKLGRPVTPQEYKLPVPEGQDGKFAEWASGIFHEAGLTSRQGQAIANKWNEYVGQLQNGQVEQIKAASAEQRANLEKEWGEAFLQQEGFAKQAAASLGVDGDMIDKLQASMGYDGVMKFFASIGEKMGEPAFLSGGQSEGPMTPAKAQGRIAELQKDRDWTAKYLAGNVDTRQELDRLMRIAYPSN